ncbi:glycoside hydrolase family 16 protein [Maribacter ulvicola]|uniref:Glycosyl hydrolases family 16 n=1 Tax=Maribacter ulvicola TaxID=228959 RepID=A0A1N6RV36_9FLAO|nr:glycoside hydrolase family 16 protein [Maribacter ulvicola]SIQ32586.1 Glycosyl hydrolases family 16 [Maribacter ulvicola]
MRIIVLIIGLFGLQVINGQTPEHILKNYNLIWSDDFNGTTIDSLKWSYRATGSKRQFGIVKEENSYLDGNGKLIIEVSKNDSIHQIGQIGTQDKFLTKYGYFECSAKMNKELGPHVAFWLQSPYIQKEKNNPKKYGTEIDIFEYHTNGGTNYVYHNLHWNGYGEHHKSVGEKIQIDHIDEGFHTFGLEWTKDEYIFYVDGKETWRTTEAISHIAEYIILSAELSGWGGDFAKSNFPDQVIFDYVKVYKKAAN